MTAENLPNGTTPRNLSFTWLEREKKEKDDSKATTQTRRA
jgi:hypothetical protein